MNRLPIIAGVILLIIALVFVNRGISNNAQPDHDEDQQKPAQQKPPTPAAGKLVASPTSIPPEIAAGNSATAPYKITVGWNYDPTSQANPQALGEALQAAHQFAQQHNNAAVEIVNLDVPADQRTPPAQAVTQPGVAVNGKVVVPGNPGQGTATPATVTAALSAAIPQK